MSSESDICPVCAEQYTECLRKKIVCPNKECQFCCCIKCVKQNISTLMMEPCCLKCRMIYSYEFIINTFRKKYLDSEIKEIRKSILLEHEKAYLPVYQEQYNTEKLKKQLVHTEDSINMQLNWVAKGAEHKQYNKGDDIKVCIDSAVKASSEKKQSIITGKYSPFYDSITNKFIDASIEMLISMAQVVDEVINTAPGIVPSIDNTNITDNSAQEKIARKFIMHCPYKECNGFLSTKYKCLVCSRTFCPKCQELLNDPHTCNPDTVKSIESIKSETKPCPKCGTRIFRSMGCSHMWCVSCNTSFDWNTLQIFSVPKANPHYYDFLRHVGNVSILTNYTGCNGAVNIAKYIDDHVCNAHHKKIYEYAISNILMTIGHIRDVIITSFVIDDDADNGNRQTLAFKYLEKSISEETWKTELFRIDRKRKYYREVGETLRTFLASAQDILDTNITSDKHPSNYLVEIITLIDTYNNYATKLNKIYCATRLRKIDYRTYNEKFDHYGFINESYIKNNNVGILDSYYQYSNIFSY
jgi:hypothetical protein